ncbi:MAG: hypothetical protein V2I62_07220 [Bacteroidales bacterium]|jgi:hypothetical protein|nr:hypothetical protein [Bacteroidales bacterium]
MDDKVKNIYVMLLNLVVLKKKAIARVSKSLQIPAENIFYEYMKGNIDESGELEDGCVYFFHGYGCTIKNDIENWKVDLEFGPCGQFYAFDKYTICHEAGFPVDSCDNVIDLLLDNDLIKMAGHNSSQISENNSSKHSELSSENERIDVAVADRYVLIEP